MILKKTIYTLINVSSNQLEQIKKECQRPGKNMDDEINVSIKNYLENMRSVLDYLAEQIFKENEIQHKSEKGKTYFPIYSRDLKSFKQNITKSFPNLEKQNPEIYSKLEKIQFYNDPKSRIWMEYFVNLVNEYKHKDFPKQNISKSKVLRVGSKGFMPISISEKARNFKMANCMIGDIEIDLLIIDKGEVIVGSDIPGLEIIKTDHEEYCFNENQKSVESTLAEIFRGVNSIIKEFKN